MRRLGADAVGRHFLKWLMFWADLEGASDSPQREGQRSIGIAFKSLCDAADPALYAGLVAEMTLDRADAETQQRAKMMAAQAAQLP